MFNKGLAAAFSLIVSLCWFSLAGVACGQNPPSDRGGGSLGWKVELPESAILLGEPLYLKIYALCGLEGDAEFSLKPYWNDSFRLTISRTNDLPLVYGGFGDQAMRPEGRYALKAGEIREIRCLDRCVFYKADDAHSGEGLVFNQPTAGAVQLEVIYQQDGQNRVFVSPPLAFSVEAPAKANDLALLQAMAADKELALSMQTGQCAPEQYKAVYELLRQYPDSSYSRWLRLALLNGLASQESEKTEVLEARLEKGLEIAGQMENDLARFFVMDEILYRKGVCFDRLGRPRQALDALTAMQRRFPTSSYIMVGDALFDKYIFRENDIPGGRLWSLNAYESP